MEGELSAEGGHSDVGDGSVSGTVTNLRKGVADEVSACERLKPDVSSTNPSNLQRLWCFDALLAQSSTVRPSVRAAIFALFEQNMKSMYEDEGTWNRAEKEEELWHEDSRFLCLFDHGKEGSAAAEEDRLVGFIMFRFDTETCLANDPLLKEFNCKRSRRLPVIYCYEIHINSRCHSLGLGSALVQAMEILGSQTGMAKCMLTVFKSNESARNFYQKRGYVKDGICPTDEEGVGYEILSRSCVFSL